MTDATSSSAVHFNLTAGLDRSLAWSQGGSVRYLVAEMSASDAGPPRTVVPALNLALAIDVSGSMSGDRIEAAQRAALVLVDALGARDRLSVVAFDGTAELLLDARPMDAAGRTAAQYAIGKLEVRGNTNLFDGWLLAAERVAVSMAADSRAAHRVLILSDGQANQGLTDRRQIAQHVGALLERGVLTSALGIGDGYDEELLGAIAEAGGGTLHDAASTPEIAEVVLSELQEGRTALLERVMLRIAVPATLRAELVGTVGQVGQPGVLEVMVGRLLPGQTKRVVVRLHCPSGQPGSVLAVGVSAAGSPPDSGHAMTAGPVTVDLHFAHGSDNNAQPRDLARSLPVVQVWQADAVREAARMNRDGEGRAAKHYLARELRWLEPYARGVPGAEALLAGLILVQRRVEERWDERTVKEVYVGAMQASQGQFSVLSERRMSLSERFAPGAPKD
jgi:Ca-activated chloride channel family protein